MQDFGFSFGVSLGFKGLSEILKATNSVDKLSKTLNLNASSTNKLAKSFENLKLKSESLKAAKTNLKKLKGDWLDAFGKGVALSVPVKINANIDESMDEINSYLQTGVNELKNYKNSLLDLSASFGAPIKEVTQLAKMGASLGISSQKGLQEFSEVGLKYQKVYKLSNDETSEFLSKLNRIYGLNTTQMNELGSAMLEVSKIAKVSASSVALIMSEVGNDAKLLGLDAKSVSALSAALASVSKDEGEAVDLFKSLNYVLGDLDNASEATKQSFKALGMDTAQLAAYFKQDAAGAIGVLLNQIKTLPEDEMNEFLKSVFGANNAGLIKNLVQNTNKYEDALKSLKKVNLNSLDDEFNKLNKSTNSSFAKLSASIGKLTARIGDALTPAIVFLCDSFTSVVNIVSDLISEYPNLSATIGTVVAVVTSASIAVTAFKTAMAVASIMTSQLGFSIKVLTTIMNVLKLACLSNPITAIFVAVAAIATLIIMNWDKVKAFFSSFLEWLSSAWDGFKGFFVRVWEFLKSIVVAYINAWKKVFSAVGEFFKNIWDGIKGFFVRVWEFLKSIVVAYINAWKKVFSAVGEFFKSIWDGIKGFFVRVWEFLKSVVTTYINIWKKIFSAVGEFFKNIFNNAFSFVKNAFSKVGEFFSGVFDYISSLLGNFVGFWTGAWSNVGEFFTDLFGGVFDWFSSKFSWLMNAFKKIKSIGKYIGLGGDDDDDKEQNATPPPPPPPVTLKQNINQIEQSPKPRQINQNLDTTVNVSVNGSFAVSSSNGQFDLGAFAKEIEKQVVKAMDKRDDKARQTSLIG